MSAPWRGLGLPPLAWGHGRIVDDLLWVTDRDDVAVVALLIGALVFLCVRYRQGARAASSDAGTSRGAILKVLLLALGLFFAVDAYLLVSALKGVDEVFWNFPKVEADPHTLRVEVNAQQWSWSFRYAGPDGAFNTADDVLTVDALRVPVDRPVLLELAASDVIHAFSLPAFRIKQDAVPGHLTRLWFRPEQEGRYEILCQQFCGVSHYRMRGEVMAERGKDFDAWLTEASRQAVLADDPEDLGAHWGWAWRTAK